jgi:hypothetical protein
MPLPNIAEKIRAYHGVRGQHDRDRSWEHCYGYFHGTDAQAIKKDHDHAALQLGFYLASWGMYRGSSFLLQYAYTIHVGVVDCLAEAKFSPLWNPGFGSSSNDTAHASLILDLCQGIKNVYQPFATALNKNVSDILLTKVVLGTSGCFPAWDTYFHEGYKHCGLIPPSRLTTAFIQGVLQFCFNHLADFQVEQTRIEQAYGMRYPLMKLVDMYFHQIGLELDAAKPGSSKR